MRKEPHCFDFYFSDRPYGQTTATAIDGLNMRGAIRRKGLLNFSNANVDIWSLV